MDHSDTPPQVASWGNVEPQFSPRQREPRFLSQGIIPILGTLTKDCINFSLILVFYLCCGSIGSVAFILDTLFNTRLFEYFIRFIEYLDTDTDVL
jgi:hypothetical protein